MLQLRCTSRLQVGLQTDRSGQSSVRHVWLCPFTTHRRALIARASKNEPVQIDRLNDGSVMYSFGAPKLDKGNKSSASEPTQKTQDSTGKMELPTKEGRTGQNVSFVASDAYSSSSEAPGSKNAAATVQTKQQTAPNATSSTKVRKQRRKRGKGTKSSNQQQRQPIVVQGRQPRMEPEQARGAPVQSTWREKQAERLQREQKDVVIAASPSPEKTVEDKSASKSAVMEKATVQSQRRSPPKPEGNQLEGATGGSHMEEEISVTVAELERCTVKQLTEECKLRGIRGYSSLRKAQLVELLSKES